MTKQPTATDFMQAEIDRLKARIAELEAPRPTIHDCQSKGMTAKEAGEVLGFSATHVRFLARKAGIKFRKPLHRESQSRIAGIQSYWADPTRNVLAQMTEAQLAEYRELKRRKYNRADAFAAVGFTPKETK